VGTVIKTKVTRYRLKPEFLERLIGDRGLRKKVTAALDVTRASFWRYLNTNSAELTKFASLTLIAGHYLQKVEDIVEPIN
jgi:hypothetical protein